MAMLLESCIAVEKLYIIYFVCRVSRNLVLWWWDENFEKHDLPHGMDDRHGGPQGLLCMLPQSIPMIEAITTFYTDVVIRALSVVRL